MLFTSEKFHLAVSIPGVTLDNQSWDKVSGAAHTADTQQHNPGGMQPAVATSGLKRRSPVTVSRAVDDTLVGLYGPLDAAVGGAITVTVQPLKNPTTTAGKARTFTGVIKSFTPPEQDSNASTIQMIELECELNETMST